MIFLGGFGHCVVLVVGTLGLWMESGVMIDFGF